MSIENLLSELTPDICFLPGYKEVHVTSSDGTKTAKASYEVETVKDALLAAMLGLKTQLGDRK